MEVEKNYIIKKYGPLTKRRCYSKAFKNLEVSDLVLTQKESFN
jgi:hypothetical protein